VKLISKEIQEFIPPSEDGEERPVVFGIVKISKPEMDHLTATLGHRKKKGWEQMQTSAMQTRLWQKCVKWIRDAYDPDTGEYLPLVDDREGLDALYKRLPSAVGTEVMAELQGMSSLDEDEVKNSGSESGSSHDETPSPGSSSSGEIASGAKRPSE
jgi:hypothetical protein